jgi:small-conductance mechanosensitive channel
MIADALHRRHLATAAIAAAMAVLPWSVATITAQTAPPSQTPAAAPAAPAPPFLASGAETLADQSATLTLANRSIVVLRATVVGRTPGERVASAGRVLDGMVEEGLVGPVEAQHFELGTVVTVGSRAVVVLTPSDIDDPETVTLDQFTDRALTRLRESLAEAHEARSPGLMLRGLALTLVALVVSGLALVAVARGNRIILRRLEPAATRTLAKTGIGDEALRQSRLLDLERRVFDYGSMALGLFIVYITTTFILRRFPYTRPWGESMRGFLLSTFRDLGAGILGAIPGLFTVVVIMLLARVLVRVVTAWFRAVEEGRTVVRWVYPETALPTRRLVTAFLWLFAIAVSYPYMPGSETDAFKGLSLFVGLLVSFGSSGLVNQLMSGFMITYSRSLRMNEFVRIGDAEGTVTHLGVLSTRIRTLQNEEITLPNAVVAAQTTTNYSRPAPGERVMTATSVTIGYDTPWRQVHALLLAAANETPGICRDPAPVVLQTALNDFYVKYSLFVCLEHQEARLVVMNALFASIQDQFNVYGVQIMSPNYVLDPATPKVVPKDQWYAAPAKAGLHTVVPSQTSNQPAG